MHLKFLALAATVAAYPAVNTEEERQILPDATNAGFFANKEFNAADQFVDVRPGSGHEFKAPKSTDIRGPCPGLNAAANHGFTSRTGVFNYEETTQGLFDAFSIGRDFTNILFVFSVFNSGSPIDMKWSIGGPMPSTTLGGLFQRGMGLSNSHNKYEGDSSPGRGDAYLHKGDAHSLNIGNYENLLKEANAGDGNYDFPSMRRHIVYTHEYTIKHNPYGFFGPNFFVSPIAHEFVTAFMSNHSKKNIGGVLNEKTLNSFFAVKREGKKLKWMPGMDRIPDNWYKRPTSNPYGLQPAVNDFQLTVAENPQIADIGGNTGKPNSYAGIEIEDLTSGVFNSKNILEGNNLGCFAFQGLIFGTPGFTSTLLNKGLAFSKLADKVTKGAISKLGCPQLTGSQYKKHKFNKYPGFTFKQPTQPATPY